MRECIPGIRMAVREHAPGYRLTRSHCPARPRLTSQVLVSGTRPDALALAPFDGGGLLPIC